MELQPIEGVVDLEGAEEREIEVVDSEEQLAPAVEETADDSVSVPKTEYEQLVAGRQANSELPGALRALAESHQSPAQAPMAPAIAKKRMTAEEREQNFLVPGKLQEVLADYGDELYETKLAPLIAAQTAEVIKLNRRNLFADPEVGPIAKEFEKEIEGLVAQIPVSMRPVDIYEKAANLIIAQKAPEIARRARTAGLDEAVDARLKEMGFTEAEIAAKKSGKVLPRVALSQQGASRMTGAGAPVVRKLTMTVADRDTMARRGMNPKDPDQVEAFLNAKKGRRN